MTYNANIPTTGQSLGVTRDPIRNNFQALRNTISQDHYPMGVTNDGKHKFVRLPINTAPANLANQGILYTKVGNGPGGTQVFFRRDAGGTEIQLSGGTVSPSLVGNGFTYLPGGLLLNWGIKNLASRNDSGNVLFNKAYTSSCFGINVSWIPSGSPSASDSTVAARPRTSQPLTEFSFVANQSALANYPSFFWIAIGV